MFKHDLPGKPPLYPKISVLLLFGPNGSPMSDLAPGLGLNMEIPGDPNSNCCCPCGGTVLNEKGSFAVNCEPVSNKDSCRRYSVPSTDLASAQPSPFLFWQYCTMLSLSSFTHVPSSFISCNETKGKRKVQGVLQS